MRYELRLSNKGNAIVESDRDLGEFRAGLSMGLWYEDQYGWFINPTNVVMFQPMEEE